MHLLLHNWLSTYPPPPQLLTSLPSTTLSVLCMILGRRDSLFGEFHLKLFRVSPPCAVGPVGTKGRTPTPPPPPPPPPPPHPPPPPLPLELFRLAVTPAIFPPLRPIPPAFQSIPLPPRARGWNRCDPRVFIGPEFSLFQLPKLNLFW